MEKVEVLHVETKAAHSKEALLDELEILAKAVLKLREELACDSESEKRALGHIRQSTRSHRENDADDTSKTL